MYPRLFLLSDATEAATVQKNTGIVSSRQISAQCRSPLEQLAKIRFEVKLTSFHLINQPTSTSTCSRRSFINETLFAYSTLASTCTRTNIIWVSIYNDKTRRTNAETHTVRFQHRLQPVEAPAKFAHARYIALCIYYTYSMIHTRTSAYALLTSLRF